MSPVAERFIALGQGRESDALAALAARPAPKMVTDALIQP
jgi:hypothetical protein